VAAPAQYVVEHGGAGHLGGIAITQWRDSNAPFTPRYIQGHDSRYATVARVRCTICGATFDYKGLKPRMSRPLLWLGLLLSAMMCVILVRLSAWAAIAATLIEGTFVLFILQMMFKPRKPHFQQLSGPVRFAHRVRRYP